jgi:hypothetical protein
MKITLKSVNEKDYKFLYDLLRQRPKNECISHKAMPTYEQHEDFCNNHPYKEWYVICVSKEPIGSVYISHLDEIGIHILKDYREYALGSILDSFRQKIKFVNISSENKKFGKILKNKGFKLIQYTYENIPA